MAALRLSRVSAMLFGVAQSFAVCVFAGAVLVAVVGVPLGSPCEVMPAAWLSFA